MIDEFWNWFSDNVAVLSPEKLTREIVTELDRRVRLLDIPAWEIGPFDDKGEKVFFALSPGGYSDFYERTQRLVAGAPSHDGWVFLPAKPPKNWNRQFKTSGSVPVDARKWEFMVYRFDDGFVDIVLVKHNLSGFDDKKMSELAYIVVESGLGEAAIMECVNAIDVEYVDPSTVEGMTIPIGDLRTTVIRS
ncbi:MAG: hypothetical protein AAFP97_10000 [Pseudomonadota bacterium]